jgi:hypothetical protein
MDPGKVLCPVQFWSAVSLLNEYDDLNLSGFIGLKNTTWTDGGTFDFHNFPSDVDNDLCPILSRDGSWHYKDCRLKSRILCKRSNFICLILLLHDQ